MTPFFTSFQRTSPGRIGRPAASALVHAFGRRWFESRLQVARIRHASRCGSCALVELEEAAVAAVDDQHVRVGAALDLWLLGIG